MNPPKGRSSASTPVRQAAKWLPRTRTSAKMITWNRLHPVSEVVDMRGNEVKREDQVRSSVPPESENQVACIYS